MIGLHRGNIVASWLALTVTASVWASPAAEAQEQQIAAAPSAVELQAQAVREARQAVNAAPQNVDARMRLADLLRQSGRHREAAQQYAQAITLRPSLYVAYHHLAQCADDAQLIDDAVEHLQSEKEKAPKELMLRVALSELLEKRRKYHDAAKTLIDLQYANAVPPKYVPRVEARIHYLLTKAKEAQQNQVEQPVATDEELDVVPSPLPDSSLKKGLTASKIKDAKELKGMGHVPLLP